MGYAIFETDWEIPHGRLRRTDTPVLVMIREEGNGRIRMSVADPDLRLPKRRNMGYLDEEALRTSARSSVLRLELRGLWRQRREEAPRDGASEVQKEAEGIGSRVHVKAEPAWGKTCVVMECRYGETQEIELESETALK